MSDSSLLTVTSKVYLHPTLPNVFLVEFSNVHIDAFQPSNRVNFASKPLPFTDGQVYLHIYPHSRHNTIGLRIDKDVNICRVANEKVEDLNRAAADSPYQFYIDKKFSTNTLSLLVIQIGTSMSVEAKLDFVDHKLNFWSSDKNEILNKVISSLTRPSLHDCTIRCISKFDSTENVKEIDSIGVAKYILMLRSPVFEAMLSSGMSESNNNTVTIDDFGIKTVKKMVEFMYKNDCGIDNYHEAMDLFCIADKYEIIELKKCAVS